MTEVIVYGIQGSPFVRAVHMILEEMRVLYRNKTVATAGLRTPDGLHPFRMGIRY